MPAIIANRTSQKTRKNINQRKIKPVNRRKKSGRSNKEDSGFIANSIYSLVRKPIPLIDLNILQIEQCRNYWKLYDELLQVYYNACGILNIIPNNKLLNPDNDFGVSERLTNLIEYFKEDFLPKGYSLNVDHNENSDEYLVSIYKELNFAWHWHYFPIGKVLENSELKSKSIKNLFIDAINTLHTCTGIPFWYNSNNYAFDFVFQDPFSFKDFVDSRLDWEVEENREETFNKWLSEKESYMIGKIADFEARFRNSEFNRPHEILRRINYYKPTKQNKPILAWIKSAMELALMEVHLSDFDYEYVSKDEDYQDESEGVVPFESQITIIWKEDDLLFDITTEMMDNEASNFGTMPPFHVVTINKDTEVLDYEREKILQLFLEKLTKLFHQFQKL